MKQLLNNTYIYKYKRLLISLGVIVVLISVLIILNANITKVSAQIIPVTVSTNHLSFGTVFPGEELEGNFIVNYIEDEGSGIAYRLIQKRKPLPPEHPEYPDGGDPQMPGYYRDLCPHLEKVSLEGENDIPSSAFVGPTSTDPSDNWTIYFRVPAIFGQVGQDHTGGVVDENGEYGCDISIDIDIEEICDPAEELVINGSFEAPVVSNPEKWNIYPSGTANLGWTVEWRGDIPATWSGYSRPDPALQELHHDVLGPAYAGEQYAELDTDWDGPGGSLNNEPASVKIYQDIPTIPGLTYNIQYYFSPRPDTTIANNVLEFSWDEDVKATNTAAGGGSISWSGYNYSFTASGNTTRLQFADLGTADSLGTFLDSVSVKCVLPQ
jgi:hypothetical protein